MAKLPEGRSTLTDEQMIGLTHRLVDTCIDCKGKIEELEERLKAAQDDAKEAEAYAEELEAKLAKAEDFVRRLNRFAVQADHKFLIEKSQEALAELTGGKDE